MMAISDSSFCATTVVVLAMFLSSVQGGISSACLDCICQVESGCTAKGCVMDSGSLSCGYYQIKNAYYQDCYSPGSGWKTCADDKTCATNCVKAYMNRYGKSYRCDIPINCEAYARLHNAGPTGCKTSKQAATERYWQRVRAKGCNSSS